MANPTMKLMSPERTTIVATLERLTGREMIAPGSIKEDALGRFDFEYEGTVEIFWEEQRTVTRDDERVFLDAEGNEFLEGELLLVPESADGVVPLPKHVITVTMEGGVIHGVQGIPNGVILRTIDLDIEGADERRITTLANGEKAYVAEWGNDAEPVAPKPSPDGV